MIEQVLARYINVDPSRVTRLLSMKQSQIYTDPEYVEWVNGLDVENLHQTLPSARQAYDRHLPKFIKILEEKYLMRNIPMSSFTLGNWLVGFLNYPNTIADLSRRHSRLPQQAVIEMLPEMIAMLDELTKYRAEWQRALALMALPLAAARD